MTATTAETRQVTDEQIRKLVALGFECENMELVWGYEYKGNWRWTLYHPSKIDPITGRALLLDFGDIDYSEDRAWAQAQRLLEATGENDLYGLYEAAPV